MKSIQFTILAIIALIITSCSSEEPKPIIDQEVLDGYLTAKISKNFDLIGTEYFERDNPESKWHTAKWDLMGWEPTANSIFFNRGQIWTPLKFYLSEGWPGRTVQMVFDVYKKRTKYNKKIYIATDLDIDTENNIITIDKYNYNIIKLTNSQLFLCDHDEERNYKVELYYQEQTLSQSEIDNIIEFSSRKEAYLYIIKLATDYFGDTINLNEIYKPNITFDDPIIDLRQLEEAVIEML